MEELNITGIDNDLVDEKFATIDKYLQLKKKKIAISVSVNENLELLGFSEQHLNDISIEIARYIIANGGTALYGGDLRINGFTYYFSELANFYKKNDDPSLRFINYFAPPNFKQLDRNALIEFKAKQIGVEKVDPGEGIVFDENAKYNPNTVVADRYLYAECYKQMRIQMAKDSVARVLVGGKSTKYLGYIPGVIEEALLTLRENKPVYLVGGFGGATLHLINLIKGRDVKELTNEVQYQSDFLKGFREFVKDKCEYSDFEKLKEEFKKYGLNKLSELNKLSVEENEILFSSKNIHEIVFLLMKGLKAIKN